MTVRPGNVSFGIAPSVEQEQPGGCGEAFSTVYNRVTVPDWRRLPRASPQRVCSVLSTTIYVAQLCPIPLPVPSAHRTQFSAVKNCGKVQAKLELNMCLFLAVSARLFWFRHCVAMKFVFMHEKQRVGIWNLLAVFSRSNGNSNK